MGISAYFPDDYIPDANQRLYFYKRLASLEKPTDGRPASVGNGVHIAFAAGTRAQVDEFYRVALANGGTDAGAPGLRPEYDANYYGAFVRDPDGNKIEAVTFSAD